MTICREMTIYAKPVESPTLEVNHKTGSKNKDFDNKTLDSITSLDNMANQDQQAVFKMSHAILCAVLRK